MNGEVLLMFLGIFSTTALFIVLGIWAILSFILTPKAAKVITKASIGKQTLLMLMQDNNTVRVCRAKVHPEGYLETVEKTPHYFFLPRVSYHSPMREPRKLDDNASVEETLEEQELYDAIKENAEMEEIEKEVTRVSMFEGCKVPVFLGYSGVAVATNPSTILGLTFESEKPEFKVLSGLKKDKQGKVQRMVVKARTLIPVVPEMIKKHFGKLIDQAQIESFGMNRERKGYLLGKSGKDMKMILIGVLALVGIGIAIMVLIKFA